MVRPLQALASRALSSHQEMKVCLLRIQDGFIPQRSIKSVHKHLEELRTTLQEMENALNQKQSKTPPNRDPFPIK
jgi:hypothetical protein